MMQVTPCVVAALIHTETCFIFSSIYVFIDWQNSVNWMCVPVNPYADVWDKQNCIPTIESSFTSLAESSSTLRTLEENPSDLLWQFLIFSSDQKAASSAEVIHSLRTELLCLELPCRWHVRPETRSVCTLTEGIPNYASLHCSPLESWLTERPGPLTTDLRVVPRHRCIYHPLCAGWARMESEQWQADMQQHIAQPLHQWFCCFSESTLSDITQPATLLYLCFFSTAVWLTDGKESTSSNLSWSDWLICSLADHWLVARLLFHHNLWFLFRCYRERVFRLYLVTDPL